MTRSLRSRGRCAAVGEGWTLIWGHLTLTSAPPWLFRDAKEPGTMKDEGGTDDVCVRSRKRKANVAVVSTKETGGGGLPTPSYLGTRLGSAHTYG